MNQYPSACEKMGKIAIMCRVASHASTLLPGRGYVQVPHLVALFLALSVTAYCDSIRADDEPVKSSGTAAVKRLSIAASPTDFARGVSEIFANLRSDDLDLLVSVPDCSVALAAGWERVRRTMPAVTQQNLIRPDANAISRFLGLIEGRLQAPVPELWEAAIKSAKKTSVKRRISYSQPRLERTPSHSKASFQRDGPNWNVTKNNQTIKVPAEDDFGPVDDAVAEITPDVGYVALYGWPPIPTALHAINRHTGKALWSSKIWMGGSDVDNFEGQGWHAVDMQVRGDVVILFGVSNRTAYIEAFDRKTGENRCRFGTGYFIDTAEPNK